MNKISTENLNIFKQTIWDYYQKNGRQFPWRHEQDPYQIVVSEIMLQQTQTHRVVQKFQEFTIKFPSFAALAQAPIRDVLIAWQGLGYNRRALALHAIAQLVVKEFSGTLPTSATMLETFPHIGPNTAGSICAFAFNQPTVFVETNIRAVFIHFFF
jgi:A/G-specific adenine glycosylase